MTYEDEKCLWDAVQKGKFPRYAIRELKLNEKAAHATLLKWAEKGLYDYGVALDMGWLTPGAVFPRKDG